MARKKVAKRKVKNRKKQKAGRKIQAYAFIDTNIFLDFYRASEVSLSMLEKLERVSNRIICTYQIEMEFLKNRQTQICRIADMAKMKLEAQLPAVLTNTQLNTSVGKSQGRIKKHQKQLDSNLLKLLDNPKGDRVYKVLEDIFRSDSEHVLTRDMKAEKAKIKRLAHRRFQLGYPPRKPNDTAMGDAFNWEWIVHCASELQGRFIIVSRDSDYGRAYKGKYFLNDQLLREFRERVGQKSVLYTQKLSDALKELEVNVTKAETETEAKEITSWPAKITVSRRDLPRKTFWREAFSGLSSSPPKSGIVFPTDVDLDDLLEALDDSGPDYQSILESLIVDHSDQIFDKDE